MMEILTDSDVDLLVRPPLARSAMRDAVVAAFQGRLASPPRTVVDVADRRLSFPCGAVAGEWYGYRSYTAPGSAEEDEVVVVHDDRTGAVAGMTIGSALGPRRTGAIGAIALDALGPTHPTAMGLLGAGRQAWHQLWAIPDRCRAVPIRVYSPTPVHRAAFATRARAELGLDVQPVNSVAEALHGADVIIVATASPTPLVGADDIPLGAYVTTVGPKQIGRAEVAPNLTRDAALVVTDSPQQFYSYDPAHILAAAHYGTTPVVHLGAVLAGVQEVPPGTRIFLNTGLAGADAWLLHAVLTRS